MYADMKNLLERIGAQSGELIQYTPQDTRVATAIFLFSVIKVDGRVRPEELIRYREILQDHLSVEPDELALFEKTVIEQCGSNPKLFPHHKLVASMPIDTRRLILKYMKEISVSDNELHEFEINLVAKAAEILGLSIEDGEF